MLFLSAALAAPPDVDTPLKGSARVRKDAALVVSVEDYTFLPDVGGATLDADALQAWLSTTRGVERITRLSDPDRAALRTGMSTAARAVRGGGTLWVYFAGHGSIDSAGKRVLLTREAAPDDPSPTPIDDLVASATTGRAKQVVFVVDADFGGVGRGGEPLGIAPVTVSPWVTPANTRVAVWSSTSAAEAPAAYPATGHGLFTWLFLGALRGWADGATGGRVNGEVSLEEAQFFVQKHARLLGGRTWNPTTEARADVMKWSLARGSLEVGPDADAFSEMAQAEKARRVQEATDRLLAQATGEWLEIAMVTAVASPAGVEKLNGFIARYELAVVQVDGLDVAVNVPEVADARTRLDEFARAERKKSGKKRRRRSTKKTKTTPPPPPPASTTSACDDLVKLEPAAMGGTLTSDDLTCLEVKLNAATRQTDRDKISRVLLANAEGKGSTSEWMRLAFRHLDSIDRSDPDLCFRAALLLSRNGTVDDADEVLLWTDYALQNKSRWEGPTFVGRVYNLHRLRAETATRLWIDAEDELLRDRTEENAGEAEEARGLAKNAAREWLDYATSAGQDTDRASTLCLAAAGSLHFCTGGPLGAETSTP
jgi:uncharacterized caspase-like protein